MVIRETQYLNTQENILAGEEKQRRRHPLLLLLLLRSPLRERALTISVSEISRLTMFAPFLLKRNLPISLPWLNKIG